MARGSAHLKGSGFATLTLAAALLCVWALHFLIPAGSMPLMALFPALLLVALRCGTVPIVGGWLVAVAAAALVLGRSTQPGTPDSRALGVFALFTVLTLIIGVRAQRALEHMGRRSAQTQTPPSPAPPASQTDTDELLTKLSHDLRTPLGTIIGWTQMLRTQASPEKVARGLEVIERNARAQTRIIEDVLRSRASTPSQSQPRHETSSARPQEPPTVEDSHRPSHKHA